MLLAIDVGNTNITIGVFDKEKLVTTFRMTTKMQRTSDEYGITIIDLLEHNEISHNEIKDAIISSVVPNVMHSLCSGMIKYFGIQPMVVEPGVKTGIRITSENPAQIGADRIVDAVGAYELYGGPVVVIDYGTATTYDFINGNGDFFAGVTSPGIRSMQAGLIFGQIGQTEYIVKNMIKESGLKDVKVVATGGLGKIIANETKYIQYYNPTLTLEGMRLIYAKQKR